MLVSIQTRPMCGFLSDIGVCFLDLHLGWLGVNDDSRAWKKTDDVDVVVVASQCGAQRRRGAEAHGWVAWLRKLLQYRSLRIMPSLTQGLPPPCQPWDMRFQSTASTVACGPLNLCCSKTTCPASGSVIFKAPFCLTWRGPGATLRSCPCLAMPSRAPCRPTCRHLSI